MRCDENNNKITNTIKSSFCSVLSSELIANWLLRHVDGMLVEKESAEDMEANIERNYWTGKGRSIQVYGGICITPFLHLHFDEIMICMISE